MIEIICTTIASATVLVMFRMYLRHRCKLLALKDAAEELRCQKLYTINAVGWTMVGRCELQDLHSGPHYIQELNGQERWWEDQDTMRFS